MNSVIEAEALKEAFNGRSKLWGKRPEGKKSRTSKTHLALDSTGLIITLGGASQATANTNSSIASHNTTSLSQTLLTLLLADLDLLLLAAATELIGTELVLGLELRPAMLGNIAFRHGVCCRK